MLESEMQLVEGHTTRALPLIPVSSMLTEVPIHANAEPRRGLADHLRRSQAERAFKAISTYNHNLKLVRQPGDSSVRGPSADVIEQSMKINEIVQRAHRELEVEVEELERRVDRFRGSVPLRDHSFRDGTWVSLPQDELRKKLESYAIHDPHTFVEEVRNSLQDPKTHARAPSCGTQRELFVPAALSTFVEKLLRANNGHQMAIELCFLAKLDGVTEIRKPGVELLSKVESEGLQADMWLDQYIGWLVRGIWYRHKVPLEQKVERGDVDACAMVRRLWASMTAYGCQDTTKNSHLMHLGGGKSSCVVQGRRTDCWCYRRVSLRLLHILQVRAYSRVRAAVMLALGPLLPEDVCELLFHAVMAAEEIPLNPRVTESWVDTKSFFWNSGFEDATTPERCFQKAFKRVYRCPRYQSEGNSAVTTEGAMCEGGQE